MNKQEKRDIAEYHIIVPSIDGADADDVIMISKTAMAEIEKKIEEKDVPEEFYLRIGLRGGGSEGTNFFIEFEQFVNDNDKVFDVDNVQVVIDSRSLFYLLGYSVDFAEPDEDNRGGFVLNA